MTVQRTQNVHLRTWRKAAITLILLVMGLYIGSPALLEELEYSTLDLRQKFFGVQPTSNQVRIIAVDEASVSEIGRWPWPRSVLAKAIRHLQDAGASVVVLDVFFPEPENAKVLAQLDAWAGQDETLNTQWQNVRGLLDNDAQLAKAVREHGRVVLSLVFLPVQESSHISAAQNAAAMAQVQRFTVQNISSTTGDIPEFYMPNMPALLVNLPALDDAAATVGHITTPPDRDGVVRRAQLILRHENQFYPAADLYAAALHIGKPDIQMNLAEFGISSLTYDNREIATDEQGRIILRYRGPEGTIPSFSAKDLLNKQIPDSELKNKIVLIGATAQGIGDIRNTPWEESYPGVEIRANTIDNLLMGNYISRPDWMSFIDLGLILVLGLLLLLMLPRLNMLATGLALIVLIGVHILVSFSAFQQEQLLFNMTYPILLILSLFVAHVVVRYFTVEREKGQIKHAFRHYVSPKVVDSVISDLNTLKLGGEKREMTVLFSDIRNFTTTSESVPAEQMVALLNHYLSAMTDKVFDHDGTLDKFIGDAVMAFWGAPVARKDHALLSCKAAVAMFEALVDIQTDWENQGAGPLDIGIGINTGPMTVGNMGSNRMFNFTVVGDAVNLASRIEGINKQYGTHLLISEGTYEQVKVHFPFIREVDIVQVKGKTQYTKIYEIMLPQHYNSFDWISDYNKVYQSMRQERWMDALAGFSRIYDRTGDPVSRYYKEQLTKIISERK